MSCKECDGGHRTQDHEYFENLKRLTNHSQRRIKHPLTDRNSNADEEREDRNRKHRSSVSRHEDCPRSADNPFKHKCICEWSKDDEYGFIPNTKCPAHGKQTKQMLSKTVPIR